MVDPHKGCACACVFLGVGARAFRPERPTERRNSRAFRGQSSTKLQVMDAPSVHDEQEEAEERAPEQTLDMPPSWVPKLKIPREIFDMRCPKVRCFPSLSWRQWRRTAGVGMWIPIVLAP